MTVCDNLLKSFSENLKQLTKMNDFLLFLRFHENCRVLHCFHRRYEFCMQKYPSKCIFIEFSYKAQFRIILSADFLKNWKISNFVYLSSFLSKNNIL